MRQNGEISGIKYIFGRGSSIPLHCELVSNWRLETAAISNQLIQQKITLGVYILNVEVSLCGVGACNVGTPSTLFQFQDGRVRPPFSNNCLFPHPTLDSLPAFVAREQEMRISEKSPYVFLSRAVFF